MKKICVVCKKEFNTSHKKVKCCSKDCGNELKRINKYNEMSEKVNEDFKTWLKRKYEDEMLSVREISVILYGNNKNNYYILECLKNFDINVRHGGKAVLTQYIGEKGEKRRETSREIANTVLQTDENRDKIREVMQTEEYRNKQSISKQGNKNGMYGVKGELHPNWNSNITDEERESKRKFNGYDEWRKEVFERDNYTCQCCGDNRGGNLIGHHKDGYDWCVERRIDVTNGVTLCENCHKKFHSIYGYGGNTEQQFEEFMNNDKKEVG